MVEVLEHRRAAAGMDELAIKTRLKSMAYFSAAQSRNDYRLHTFRYSDIARRKKIAETGK
jgi:hypothetical protein